MRKIRSFIYSVKNGIENTVNWLPIIWKDRNFDDYYFHKIMLHKLKNMENFFRSDNTWSANSKNDADNIKYAIHLLERITNDVYLEEALKPFNKKYTDHKREFKKCEDGMYKLINNETKEQKELRTECYMEADELEKKDYDDLYKFLREHVQEWWD